MIRGGARQYIIGLGGVYHLCSRNTVQTVKGIEEVSGAAWLVADVPGSVPQLATVETEAKYAEVILRKRLQESGEFEGQLHLISHWKKDRGKNVSAGLFTALPLIEFTKITEKCKAASDSILFFPLYTALYRILLQQNPVTPQALVFRHGRFAEILVATLKEVYAAVRIAAFDLSEEQIQNLWRTLSEELGTIGKTSQITIGCVHYLNWFDAEPEPLWAGEPGLNVTTLPQARYEFDGEDKSCSFIPSMAALLPKDSSSPPLEVALDYCRNWVAPLSLIFMLLGAACIWGIGWLAGQREIVDQNLLSLRQTLDTYATDQAMREIPYQDSLKFVQGLAVARQARHFDEVVEDLTASAFRGLTLAGLEVEYSPQDVRVKVTGLVETGFESAMNGYQAMLRNLRSKGYEVVEDTFSTDISQASFLLALRRPHDEG